MSSSPKTGAEPAGTSSERHGRDLREVNERLRELVVSLRSHQERRVDARVQPASPPPPAPAAAVGAKEPEARLAEELALARERLDRAAKEREELCARLAAIELENRRVCDEYVEIQERSTAAAQLYVTLERLHGGLARADVLAAIQEIVINVIGSEELAVFERRGDVLALVRSFGVDPAPIRTVRLGEGAIGRAAATGVLYVAGRGAEPDARDGELTACIPLRVEERVVGVVAFWRLLGHKPGLDERDQSVFDLLAAHAGLALHLRPSPGAP